jgi:ABC-2 type transport system permease protein
VIGTVVRNSWLALRRDRAAVALSFVVPIVFFSIFAIMFGGGQKSGVPRVDLIVVDEDGSEISRRLLAALAGEPALRTRTAPRTRPDAPAAAPYDRAAAEAAVRAGEVPLALVVPRGFGDRPLAFGREAGATPSLLLLADRADPIAPQVVQGLVQKVSFTAFGDLFLAGGLEAMDAWGAEFTGAQRERFDEMVAFLRERERLGAGAGGGGQGDALPIQMEVRDLTGEGKKSPLVTFYALGLGVMFLLFSAAGAGGALIEERESGTLDRLLSTRLTMGRLLTGKLLFLTSMGLTQISVMFLWGQLVFGVDLFGHLPGFLLMATTTALAASAFGLVLAAVCRTRKQLVAVSNLVILSISALGGSMFPRFLMPEAIQRVSLAAFNSWALEGFLDVFWREEPFHAALPEAAVLLVWAAVFFAIALRIARGWERV